ncbi:pilus assembly protein [Cellulomonas oligotrophica]|uniref:pilus assembly protein n=1 Tax=Cellulomonas oligotrophica TaxID=931536 RepID=UPI003570A5F0
MGRLRRWWEARRDRLHGDGGNAVVEFLGVALVLLVPTVYLVLVLGRIQAGTFAVEGAAREAARVYVAAPDAATGAARAVTAVGVALDDQGFDDPAADALAMACSATPCLTPGAQVQATVTVRVPLPFVPSFVRDVVPLEVPVSAQRTAPVDAFRVGR